MVKITKSIIILLCILSVSSISYAASVTLVDGDYEEVGTSSNPLQCRFSGEQVIDGSISVSSDITISDSVSIGSTLWTGLNYVANSENGKRNYFYRRAPEGTNSISMYTADYQASFIASNSTTTAGSLIIQATPTSGKMIFQGRDGVVFQNSTSYDSPCIFAGGLASFEDSGLGVVQIRNGDLTVNGNVNADAFVEYCYSYDGSPEDALEAIKSMTPIEDSPSVNGWKKSDNSKLSPIIKVEKSVDVYRSKENPKIIVRKSGKKGIEDSYKEMVKNINEEKDMVYHQRLKNSKENGIPAPEKPVYEVAKPIDDYIEENYIEDIIEMPPARDLGKIVQLLCEIVKDQEERIKKLET